MVWTNDEVNSSGVRLGCTWCQPKSCIWNTKLSDRSWTFGSARRTVTPTPTLLTPGVRMLTPAQTRPRQQKQCYRKRKKKDVKVRQCPASPEWAVRVWVVSFCLERQVEVRTPRTSLTNMRGAQKRRIVTNLFCDCLLNGDQTQKRKWSSTLSKQTKPKDLIFCNQKRMVVFYHMATWLILPVVICLSQRLSHASLSISLCTTKLQMAH